MNILPIVAASAALMFGMADAAPAQDQSVPAASPSATQNPAVKSPDNMANTPLAKGHNSFTKGEAKVRIEKAGYTDVAGLALDSDGLWQAHAIKDGQPVNVALDYKGNVASQ
jgi:hypothetical protein